MPKIQACDSIVRKIVDARYECILSATEGNYKRYKNACKNNAKLTLENYEIATQINSPKITVPLYSAVGLNMLKIAVLSFFRRKTPEEKQLMEMKRRHDLLGPSAEEFKKGK